MLHSSPGLLLSRSLGMTVLFVSLCFSLTATLVADETHHDRDVLETPAFDSFVVLPLELHVLQSSSVPELQCDLTDEDLARILGKVNAIWNKAGIHRGLVSIVREPAIPSKRFLLMRDLGIEVPLNDYRAILPTKPKTSKNVLSVYYLHAFPVNGVWLGDGVALVQETAKLRPVEGGIDEPLPRVTAHELGHALGLSHRQDRVNLMASGTTGISFNTAEVKTSRAKAGEMNGALTVQTLREKAEAPDLERSSALRYWTWLSEIPGGPTQLARRRIEELGVQ